MFFGLVQRLKVPYYVCKLLSQRFLCLWCAIKCTALQVSPLWCHKGYSYPFQASDSTPKPAFILALRDQQTGVLFLFVFARGCKQGAKHGDFWRFTVEEAKGSRMEDKDLIANTIWNLYAKFTLWSPFLLNLSQYCLFSCKVACSPKQSNYAFYCILAKFQNPPLRFAE